MREIKAQAITNDGVDNSAPLQLRDITKSVSVKNGTKKILDGVSLSAAAGEVTVLLGPNGAGKSTTLAIAQGLDAPDSGSVKLLGTSPWKADAGLRSQVGVMLQDGGLPPGITAQRLLRHVAGLYEHPVDVTTLSERLGIDEFETVNIRRLSGGQKQRVALAAALLGRPRVVFLDEPSAGLDPVSRKVVFDLVSELKAAGVCIILTTHLLDDAEKLADKVVMIRHGRVVGSGTVAELTRTSAVPALQFSLATEIPDDAREIFPSQLRLARDDADESPGVQSASRWRVDGVSTPEDYVALARWWQIHQLMPTEVHMKNRSLEDVFWELSE